MIFEAIFNHYSNNKHNMDTIHRQGNATPATTENIQYGFARVSGENGPGSCNTIFSQTSNTSSVYTTGSTIAFVNVNERTKTIDGAYDYI